MNFQNRLFSSGLRGRPLKGEEPLNRKLHIALTEEMRETIEEKAHSEEISLADAARDFMQDGIKAQGRGRSRKRINAWID